MGKKQDAKRFRWLATAGFTMNEEFGPFVNLDAFREFVDEAMVEEETAGSLRLQLNQANDELEEMRITTDELEKKLTDLQDTCLAKDRARDRAEMKLREIEDDPFCKQVQRLEFEVMARDADLAALRKKMSESVTELESHRATVKSLVGKRHKNSPGTFTEEGFVVDKPAKPAPDPWRDDDNPPPTPAPG